MGESDVFSTYFEDLKKEGLLSLLGKSDRLRPDEGSKDGAIESSLVRADIKRELGASMREGDNLRIEMLIRCLLSFDEVSAREVSETLVRHRNMSEVASRIGNILTEKSLLVDFDFGFLEEREDSEEMSFLTRMAISELDMKPEEMKKILDMQDERDISRRLFLLAESISAGRIFLNLFNGGRRFGSVSLMSG